MKSSWGSPLLLAWEFHGVTKACQHGQLHLQFATTRRGWTNWHIWLQPAHFCISDLLVCCSCVDLLCIDDVALNLSVWWSWLGCVKVFKCGSMPLRYFCVSMNGKYWWTFQNEISYLLFSWYPSCFHFPLIRPGTMGLWTVSCLCSTSGFPPLLLLCNLGYYIFVTVLQLLKVTLVHLLLLCRHYRFPERCDLGFSELGLRFCHRDHINVHLSSLLLSDWDTLKMSLPLFKWGEVLGKVGDEGNEGMGNGNVKGSWGFWVTSGLLLWVLSVAFIMGVDISGFSMFQASCSSSLSIRFCVALNWVEMRTDFQRVDWIDTYPCNNVLRNEIEPFQLLSNDIQICSSKQRAVSTIDIMVKCIISQYPTGVMVNLFCYWESVDWWVNNFGNTNDMMLTKPPKTSCLKFFGHSCPKWIPKTYLCLLNSEWYLVWSVAECSKVDSCDYCWPFPCKILTKGNAAMQMTYPCMSCFLIQMLPTT